MLIKGKKILVGITGSIAAYKSAMLVRLLTKAGAEVKVVMTPAAADFISPLTLATLSRNEVTIKLTEGDTWANHVMLGRWADIMLIAPMTCNTLAKTAHGICDNLLMAVILSATCPIVIAPAMDEDMWMHPGTQSNLQIIQKFGFHIMPVVSGPLASGLVGYGRMSEPEVIIAYLESYFKHSSDFAGKKVLITAGATLEPLDPVRFISNHSSGKMGVAMAAAFMARGADVYLVCGKISVAAPNVTKLLHVVTADEMYQACVKLFPEMDIAVMCAAVADYTPVNKTNVKIKKQEASLQVELEKTKDILHTLGKQKNESQFLVGFALETNNELENAKEKLVRKNANMIVLNSLNVEGAGFEHDTNKVNVLLKDGRNIDIGLLPKREIADKIINVIKDEI